MSQGWSAVSTFSFPTLTDDSKQPHPLPKRDSGIDAPLPRPVARTEARRSRPLKSGREVASRKGGEKGGCPNPCYVDVLADQSEAGTSQHRNLAYLALLLLATRAILTGRTISVMLDSHTLPRCLSHVDYQRDIKALSADGRLCGGESHQL
jgi:hypothetical protein